MRAMESFDIAVIGAGAAGMMCAAVAAQSGRRVVLIDHAERLAEKIRISGGGRCNFTNINAGPANFLSANPHFCRSALARYTPRDFLALLKQYRVSWHEKHKGQLFCDDSSESIINLLKSECDAGRVAWRRPVTVETIRHNGERFSLDTTAGTIDTAALIIATGGLSIPKIGATDFGYRVAKQFGHKLIDMRPALVPLTFAADDWAPFAALSGLSVAVELSTGKGKTRGEFSEDLLLTHRGLSGPGVLQISSYWNPSRADSDRSAAGRRRHRGIAGGKGRLEEADRHLSLGTRAGAPRAYVARSATRSSRCPPRRSAGQDAQGAR